MTIPMTPAEPEKKPLIMRWVTDHPDRILFGLTVFTVGLALLFLALWVVTNLLWAAEDAELRLIEKTNSETGAVVRVDYPAVVLANSQPVTFTFTVRNVTDTVTVAVPILDSVRQVVTAASEVAPLTMTLPITPITGNAGVATIAFVNVKIDRGIRSWTCMNVSVSAPVSLTVPVCFNVEGTWGLAARSFISIAVTDKSPLIVLIVTFITGTGALLPGLLRQQADRNADRRKKEEERRVQQQEAAMQRRKDKAAQAVRFFRGHLVKQELEAAQGDLRELEDPALVDFAAVELPLMRSLVQLATAPDDADLIELVKQTAIWPNECAAAYLMAYQRLHHINPSVLREAKNFVPAGFVSDETLRADLQKAAQSFPEVQRLIWPVVRNLAVPVSDNPFQHELADDDRAALFGVPSNDRRPAYWPGHTVSGAVRNSDRPQVVFGEHGSGRTAMSLALGKYMIGQSIRLSLYLPGQSTNDGISSGYARLLLDFVQAYPTHLSKLSSSDRSLLARVLINGPSNGYVLAEIEKTRLSREWQSQAIPKPQHDFGLLGDAQLDLLMRAIGDAPPDRLSESEWPWAINRCARALGFERKQVSLVVDSASSDPAWLQSFVMPRLLSWWQAGLVAIVFAPQIILDGGFKIEDGVTQIASLKWTPNEFRTMLRHRYTSLLGRRHQIEEAFVDQLLFDDLMRGSRYNPHNFVHLWNACRHELGDRAKIDAASVKTVFEREGIA